MATITVRPKHNIRNQRVVFKGAFSRGENNHIRFAEGWQRISANERVSWSAESPEMLHVSSDDTFYVKSVFPGFGKLVSSHSIWHKASNTMSFVGARLRDSNSEMMTINGELVNGVSCAWSASFGVPQRRNYYLNCFFRTKDGKYYDLTGKRYTLSIAK